MIVRCPQCGTEFDKDANEFCPNPACGYPSAFILAPEADEEQPDDDMTRHPGEQATAPQPVVPAPTPTPTPGPPPTPALPPTAPAPVAPVAPPRRRQPPLIALIGIGFAIGVAIILLVWLLTRGGGGSPAGTTSPGTSVASPAVTPECTTAFFQGSLGERVLGLCSAAMRGNDVRQLQLKLNQVLAGQRVLVVDGSFGPRTATAVAEYQRCRGLPATSIVDTATANRLVHETAVDACPTSLPDLGPPHQPSPSPKVSPSPSPSESPSPSPTATLPTTT